MSGVTVTTPSTSVTVPPAMPVVSMAVTTSAPPSRSASVSLAAGLNVIGVFCGVLGASATATGAKSSSVTVPVATVASTAKPGVEVETSATWTDSSPFARSSFATGTSRVPTPSVKLIVAATGAAPPTE